MNNKKDFYYLKYLKYKQKYLELKQNGGDKECSYKWFDEESEMMQDNPDSTKVHYCDENNSPESHTFKYAGKTKGGLDYHKCTKCGKNILCKINEKINKCRCVVCNARIGTWTDCYNPLGVNKK